MTPADKIIARARELGVNIAWDAPANRLFIPNMAKLPERGQQMIRENAKAIAEILRADEEARFEERAAIIEFDGKAPRQWAEQFAKILTRLRPDGVSDFDWAWFVSACGRIIDEAPERSAA